MIQQLASAVQNLQRQINGDNNSYDFQPYQQQQTSRTSTNQQPSSTNTHWQQRNQPFASARPHPFQHNSTRSNNPDFTTVYHSIRKIAQINHHYTNWQRVPPFLIKRVQDIVENIKPPNPNEALRRSLNSIARNFTEQVQETVQNHLLNQLTIARNAAATLDSSDVERAKSKINKFFSDYYTRMDPATRQQLIDEAAAHVGSARQQQTTNSLTADVAPTNIDSRPHPLPSTSAAPDQACFDTNDWITVTNKASAATPAAMANGKRKQLSPVNETSPLPTSNRFQALSDDSSSEDSSHEETAMDTRTAHVSPSVPPPASKKKKRTQNSTTSPIVDPWADVVTPAVQQPLHSTVPSEFYTTTSHGVYVYLGGKDDWRLDGFDTDKTLIIADSNFRRADNIPEEAIVISLPGAHLRHAANAIRHWRPSKPNQKLKLLVQVGINNRSDQRDTRDSEVQHLIHSIKSHQHIERCSFVGISIPESMTAYEQNNLDVINDLMRSGLGPDRFIEPLPEQQVEVEERDRFGIHYTNRTGRLIMSKIQQHLDNSVFHQNPPAN